MSLAGAGTVGSPSPTVRRATPTNPAATATWSPTTDTTTQGQINAYFSPQFNYDYDSDRQSFCRHCGEELESITSSRRSSRSRKEPSPTSKTRSSQTDIIGDDYDDESITVEKEKPYTWQRSASCKELNRDQKKLIDVIQPVEKIERNLDAPVTRYDESRRSCYSITGSKTPSLDRSNVDVPETKVYSSSYPGTTSSLSTESGANDDGSMEPGGSVLVIDMGSSREEMILSHDDLSHDSYELLERERCDIYGESRSVSIDSTGDQILPDDEMFVMDEDFDTKENSDVEKRLGYVEPRYTNMNFNEFNEKCKQEIAYKRAVEFSEFDAKCRPGMVIGFDDEISSTLSHFPVERTKSDPYVSDFWRVAKQHRRLLHQKSIDLTPTESSGADSGGAEDYKHLNVPCTSRSVVDIPYTLHKRHQMNGTVPMERSSLSVEQRSPQQLSPKRSSPIYMKKSPEKSPDLVRKTKSPKKVCIEGGDRLSKTKMKPDLNSQDSGLSLSLGTESVDDIHDVLTRNVDNIIGIEFEGRGDEVKRKIIRESSDSRQSSFENVEMDTLKVDDERYRPKPLVKKDLIKVKSEETKSKKGILSKVRHVHSADSGIRKESSFEKRDSAIQVIKIDSDSSQDICSCGSDRKDSRQRDIKSSSLDSSDPDVIIVEYRGNRKKAFQKRSSSGSKESMDKEKEGRRSTSLDAPKGTKDRLSKADKSIKELKSDKELKDSVKKISKRDNKFDRGKLSKDDSKEKQKLKSETRPNERTIKAEVNIEKIEKPKEHQEVTSEKTRKIEYFKDVVIISESDTKKEIELVQIVKNGGSKELSPDKPNQDAQVPEDADKKEVVKEEPPPVKSEQEVTKVTETPTKKQSVIAETTWKKFGDLPAPITHKRERSPILFARLGLSEGSTFAPRQSSVVSPSSSRRAKSLDAPVVSLHRLPPVTSFSSKDDTVDNDENIELEEKALRQGKQNKKDDVNKQTGQIKEEEEDEAKIQKISGKDAESISESALEEEKKSEIPIEITESVEDIKVVEKSEDELTNTSNKNTVAVEERRDSKEHLPEMAKDDIAVTLEKLDEVVDRVKENNFITRKGSKVDNLVLDKEMKDGRSPCLSPNAESSKSPCLSPKDPPKSPCLSPNDPPHSPCRVQDGEPSPCAERRPSTRKERLDSFKNKKSYSVDIWTSEEVDAPGVPTLDVDIDYTSNDFDDETFIIPEPSQPAVEITKDEDEENEQKANDLTEETLKSEDLKGVESGSDIYELAPQGDDQPKNIGNEIISTEDECWDSTDDIPDGAVTVPKYAVSTSETGSDVDRNLEDKYYITEVVQELPKEEVIQKGVIETHVTETVVVTLKDESKTKVEETLKETLQLEVIEGLDEPSTSDKRFIPEKRSFDEEPSSSSSKSVKPELSSTWKPFPLESSGSSSLEEGIFPPDDTGHYADEEEGSSHSNNGQDDFPTGFGYPMTSAELIISGYSGGMFGLSRTLSRISERSTTSEQERSDFEDDISTKPSSRSLSVDDESLLSSDRQPSLSSDPPSGTNHEVPFEDRALPELPPLPPEPKKDVPTIKLPAPLLPTHEEDWPSPPNSSPFDTPVISHIETFYMEIKPEEATKVVVVDAKDLDDENGESSTDENKTLQEEPPSVFEESSTTVEGTVKLAVRPKNQYGNSVSEDTSLAVSDFSSSTGTTVKHCQYYSCAVKSDDNSSLAGDFGLSLSTEMLSSRKNSDDSIERFQTKRSGIYVPQRSFDDYDSPYSESDEGQPSPCKTPVKRRVHQASSAFYANVPLSPTSVVGSKKTFERGKFDRRTGGLRSTPYYSAPVPVSHESRDVSEAINVGNDSKRGRESRSKCYSYYSLARDPPSDGSSSSLDNQEPPTAPNTIPRVSKRRRHHTNTTKRRHRVSVDMEIRDGHIVSVSSPSVIACSSKSQRQSGSQKDLSSDHTGSRGQQQQLISKQSSV